MNYLLAILFMVTMTVSVTEIKKRTAGVTPLNFNRYSSSVFLGMSILVCFLMAQFILLSNGFARLMEL